jgi:hypothetical protein
MCDTATQMQPSHSFFLELLFLLYPQRWLSFFYPEPAGIHQLLAFHLVCKYKDSQRMKCQEFKYLKYDSKIIALIE